MTHTFGQGFETRATKCRKPFELRSLWLRLDRFDMRFPFLPAHKSPSSSGGADDWLPSSASLVWVRFVNKAVRTVGRSTVSSAAPHALNALRAETSVARNKMERNIWEGEAPAEPRDEDSYRFPD